MKWDVAKYNRNARYVSECGEALLEILSPVCGEVILDVGCGDGELAEKIAALGCSVVGIDSSSEMVATAKGRGIKAQVLDAQKMNFDHQFDAVFSNAALHWMKDADAVIRNVHAALKPSGRFCAEFGARNNIRAVLAAIYAQLKKADLNGDDYNPWYFPSGAEYRSKLEKNGFEVIELDVFERPTRLPTDIVGWLDTFAADFLRDIPLAEHARFVENVADEVCAELQGECGHWFADYVRCRFLARKI
ncbi:MAG: class I SAM-dependent methyltransferase [bacterium]